MAEKVISRSVRCLTIAAIFMTASICIINFYGHKPLALHLKLTTNERPKILIIMTQIRSGSSFTGEIFAASHNSTYLYEPLYPFCLNCHNSEEKESLLKQLLNCDFFGLENIYAYAKNKTNFSDGAGCAKNGFCFASASTGLLGSYAKACSKKFPLEPRKCRFPLRADVLEAVCKSSALLITKVTRICTMEEMEKIYSFLKITNKDIFILHLVRDLRSIASSHMKLKGYKNSKGIAKEICTDYCHRQRHNLEYVAKAAQESEIVRDGRYMRIRYEDLATDAVREAKRVFKFMGSNIPSEVVDKIRNYLHPSQSVLEQISAKKRLSKKLKGISAQYKNAFGVVRDPAKVLRQWRNLVPFEVVRDIQDECGDVLRQLGYTIFESEKQMKDPSLPSFNYPSG